MKTNKTALALIVLSFTLLVPGLFKPLLTITASLELMGVKRELFTETRSIIQTVRSLHESGNNFVSGLILLFSVIVPFAKAITLLVVLAIRNIETKLRLHRFIDSISKWSMADVFLVGVYVAYLSAKATDNLDATIHEGFYYFAAYCLVSIGSLHFMRLEKRNTMAELLQRS